MEGQVKLRTARSLTDRLTAATTTSTLSSVIAEIRLLSKHDPQIRSPLADSGLIPILTHLLLENENEDEDENEFNSEVQENACAALLNLSICVPEFLMSTPSLLPSLSKSLRNNSSPVLAQHAAATLYSLLSVESYRPIIGSKASIISPLISILNSPSSPTRSIKDSLKALFGITLYPLNRSKLIGLGIVPALFRLVVKDGRMGIVEDVTAVIAQVAGCNESLDEFGRVGGVRILVDLMGDYCDKEKGIRARENAVAALLNMAMSGGERAVGEIREVEMVEEVVRELVERGSKRGRRKGMELLKVLESGRRRSWDVWRELDDGFSGLSMDSSNASSSSSRGSYGCKRSHLT